MSELTVAELQERIRDIEEVAKSLNENCDGIPGRIDIKLLVHKILDLCTPQPTYRDDITRIVEQQVAGNIGDAISQEVKIRFQNDLIEFMTEFVDGVVDDG